MRNRTTSTPPRPVALVLAAALLAAAPAAADDWPTVHHDVARSARSADSPSLPFSQPPKYKWVAHFCLENIDTRVEAIVAGQNVFVGTLAGNLYCLDRATGKVRWRYDAGGPVIGSPAVYESTVYVGSAGSLAGGGALHAVDPASGRARWTLPARFGFATSPCCTKGLVMLGGRDGAFYAVDARTGKLRWRYQAPEPIYTTAAATDDAVLFAAEDARARCLDLADGKLRWKSPPMYAATLAGYYPIIWGDAAVFFTQPAVNNSSLREAGFNHLGKVVGGETTSALSGKWKRGPVVGNPAAADWKREQEVVLKYLNEDPRRQSAWAFRLSDGRKKFTVPKLYSAGNDGVDNPGAVDAAGWLYTTSGSYFSNWSGNYPYCVVRIHCRDGRWELLNWAAKHPKAPIGWSFTLEYNEAYNFTLGGGRLFFAHSDAIWGLELAGRVGFRISGRRDLYGNIYGGLRGERAIQVGGVRIARAPNEWHGTGRGALSVCGKELLWCVGGMVICLEGT